MSKQLAINLTEKQKTIFFQGYEELDFKIKSEITNSLIKDYEKTLHEPHPSNPDYKDFTKEEFFIDTNVRRSRENILHLSFYDAYINNKPEVILNGFYTFNHLFSIRKLQYPDSVSFLDLLCCYSGNNIKLADYYLEFFFKSKKQPYQLWNVIPLAIKSFTNKELINSTLASIEKYLSMKNGLFYIALVNSFKAILLKDMELFSESLSTLVKLHPKSQSLNYFSNSINKYVPYLAYSVFTIASIYLDKATFEKIKTPVHNLWWDEFIQLNIKNSFSEGKPYIDFNNQLLFLNKKIY